LIFEAGKSVAVEDKQPRIEGELSRSIRELRSDMSRMSVDLNAKIDRALGFTQEEFAARYHIPKGDWNG